MKKNLLFVMFSLLMTVFAFGQQEGPVKVLLSESGGNPGCLAPSACNYDETADYDDGTCEFPGCLDDTACNFQPDAPCDGDCFYTVDCNGVCGGVYIEEGCNCYNPNIGEYESMSVEMEYNMLYAELPNFTIYDLSDDDMAEATLPFDFNFYGVDYSAFWISSNGFISFTNLDEDNGCCEGTVIPSGEMYSALGAGIAPNWADYYPSVEGTVYTAGNADYFMVGFDGVPTCCGSSNHTSWQLLLYPDGSFTVNLLTVEGNENLHIIGYQNEDGSEGELFHYGQELNLSEVAYHVSIVQEPEACQEGCTDPSAFNYDFEAFEDDGSCLYNNNCGTVVDADGNGADFYGDYAPDMWTFENIGGEGTLDHTNSSIFITGSNTDDKIGPLGFGGGGGGDQTLAQVTIEATETGTYSFDWDYSTDDGPDYDIGYYINGVRIDLTQTDGGLMQNGSVSFDANQGDIIGFGVDATDDCCGAGFLTITNFRYPDECIGGCFIPTADNYNPEADFDDFLSCVWTNECGDETDSNGNGAFFSELYSPEFWTQEIGGDGDIDVEYIDEEETIAFALYIQGSNQELEDTDVSVSASITIPVSGTHSFGWEYSTDDESSVNDPAFYSINGTVFILTQEFDEFGEPIGSDGQSGFISLELEEGDVFELGVLSVNDCCGEGYLSIYQFAWPINCVGGCQDEAAMNYNPEADYDNEWCMFMNDCEETVDAEGNGVNFSGAYAEDMWTYLSEGDGMIEVSEESALIYGSDTNDGGDAVLTEMTIEVTMDGTYSFDWTYFTIDGADYDIAYFINDERTDLSQTEDGLGGYYGNSGQSGTVTLELTAGTILGFGIEATDDCCGLGTLTIDHFSYPMDECIAGCTDETACNYDEEANFDDGSCDFESCAGCLDPTACNYDEEATINDDSCEFESCAGCTDETACNYDPEAIIENGSCDFESCAGCLDEEALNYDPEATIDSEDCIYECELPGATFEVMGCDEATFTVEISVSDLGNGAPYTISNSIDDETIVVDAEGTFDVSGFPIGEVVVITIESAFGEVCSVVSDELGCPFSINEENQLSLNLFPNPANATLTIQSTKNTWSSVQIIDLAGRIVLDEQMMLSTNGVVIQTAMLAEGNYLVRITSDGATTTEKVMIQH